MAFRNERYSQAIYVAHGGTGKGASASDPLPIADGALMDALPDMVVDSVDVVVTTTITGLTVLDVGDGTDPNGYVAAAGLTAGVSTGAGALLSKHYTSADTIDLDVTGTSTAGAAVIVVSGYMI